MRKWNNDLLEPVVITYNRSRRLERMLRTFVQAGYTSMRFHVLDNCSTDDTRDVVERYQRDHWPLLQYHCNRYNIGGDANILRAVEIGNSKYFCVFGDDDEWNLEYFDEVNDAMEEQKADIIRLGWWVVSEKTRGKLLPALDLALSERMFFYSLLGLSNVIMRRSLITSDLFCAYNSLDCHAPLLPTIWKALESRNLSIYTTSHDICSIIPNEAHDEPAYWLGDLGWEASWVRHSKFLQSPALRARHVKNVFEWGGKGYLRQLTGLIFRVLVLKGNGFSQRQFLIELLQDGQGMRGTFVFLLLLDLFVPRALMASVVAWRRRLGGSLPLYYRSFDDLIEERRKRT